MAQAAYQKSKCEKEKERFECGADARQERRLMTQQRALSEIRPMSAAGLLLQKMKRLNSTVHSLVKPRMPV